MCLLYLFTCIETLIAHLNGSANMHLNAEWRPAAVAHFRSPSAAKCDELLDSAQPYMP